MPPSPPSSAAKPAPSTPLAPDLVLRVGFAGKRELDAAQSETVRHRLRDIFSTIGWRLVEIVFRILSSNQESKINNPQASISPGLPHIGSFQTPAAAPAQYASRAIRQSVVDWLFDAIIRSVSPAHFAKPTEVPRDKAPPISAKVLTINPADSLDRIGKFWILSQAAYHRDNAGTMQRLSHFLERWGKTLNIAVIIAVGTDVFLVTVKLTRVIGKDREDHAVVAGALLVFVAAVIPAAVAAFNGIRFQSECQRLAERSAVMPTILEGRPAPVTHERNGGRLAEIKRLHTRIHSARQQPDADPGSWTLESLHLSEKVANDFVPEVAEWSVLYAKELVEP